MSEEQTARLLDPLFTTNAMREIFSDRRRLQGMLDFEVALARALARADVRPQLPSIRTRAMRRGSFCAGLAGARSSPCRKSRDSTREALTATVAKSDAKAAGFVHWGATSQDAIDTGLVLQMRDALDILAADLANFRTLASSLRKHATTLIVGRTWLQQASPDHSRPEIRRLARRNPTSSANVSLHCAPEH